MKKVLFMFIVIAFMFMASCGNGENDLGKENDKASKEKLSIEFSSPIDLKEVISLCVDNEFEIEEVEFQIGQHHGGLTLLGLSTDEELNNFYHFFKKSLEEMLSSDIIFHDEDETCQGEEDSVKELIEFSKSWENGEKYLPVVSIIVQEGPCEYLTQDSRVSRVSLLINQTKTHQSEDEINYKSYYHEPWAPYYGYSKVTHSIALHRMYFNNTSSFGYNSTYEQETQIGDRNFANYAGYWQSNLPCAYKDTQFLDRMDNFTVGSTCARNIRAYYGYYTSMSLYGQGVSNSLAWIKGQIGHRYPSWCYSTWCVFADATSGSLAYLAIPDYGVWWTY